MSHHGKNIIRVIRRSGKKGAAARRREQDHQDRLDSRFRQVRPWSIVMKMNLMNNIC